MNLACRQLPLPVADGVGVAGLRAVAGRVETLRAVLPDTGLLTGFRLLAAFRGTGFRWLAAFRGTGFGPAALAILVPARVDALTAFDTELAADAGRRRRFAFGGENALIRLERADFLRANRVAPLRQEQPGDLSAQVRLTITT